MTLNDLKFIYFIQWKHDFKALKETFFNFIQVPSSSLGQGQQKLELKKASLDPDVLSNYRPVSNLSFISKILEKVVSKRLDTHKTVHGLYEPFQSAYRRGHSTETAVLRVQNDILRAVDDGHCVLLVLLDLSAAFDTVSHNIILRRLSSGFGIKGNAIKWIESYLRSVLYQRPPCFLHTSTRPSISYPLTLDIPKTKLVTYGDKSFSVKASQEWNKLPLKIRSSTSINSFKSQLKTNLFKARYD